MVLFRPLRLLQRLDEPLSVLVHKVCLCCKINRGSSSLCSSLRGLNSTIQLRIDSYQPAQACPWKYHNAVYTIVHINKIIEFSTFRLCLINGFTTCSLSTISLASKKSKWLQWKCVLVNGK